MDAQSTPSSFADAQSMLEENQERKAKLDARTDSISLAQSTGQRLLAAWHASTPRHPPGPGWFRPGAEQPGRGLAGAPAPAASALELQLVLSSVEQVESWLCSLEACPASEGLGDFLLDVETLLWKMHERDLEAQAETISALEASTLSLHQGGQPEAQGALGRCQAMLLRKEALLEQARTHHRQLEEPGQLQASLQGSYEVAAWLREKNLVVLEEGWQAPARLQAQLRRQQDLQAEQDTSVHHQQRLQTALCLRRSVEELEKWLEPVELKLRAPIGGPEQPGLDELLGAQGELDRQAGPAQAFVWEGHCLAQDVEEQAQRLLQRPALHCCRFESQRAPLRERRTALEARSLLLQFFRDAKEEMAWVREKLPLTAARDCDQSPSALRRLQEKCQNLETEMSSHEALTRAAVGTGRELVQAGHFAARDVAARARQLEDAVGHLQAEAAQRRQRLQQAQEAQQSLMELPEAESWLEERGCVQERDIEDMGQSAEATQAFLRWLEATRRDLEGFSMHIERLQQTAALLESGQNPETPKLLALMFTVRDTHSGLWQRAEGREQGLREQLQLHQLEWEALLLDTWLASKVATAESQDYGQDLEAVKVLEEKFDAFRKEVQSLGQAKVQAPRKQAGSLEWAAPRCSPQIQGQRSHIEAAWERLDRAVKARTQTLAMAREVCGFEQAAAELRGWMQEKVALVARDACGRSPAPVQTLQQQHRCLEREPAAMEKEVAQVQMETCQLGQLHPVAQEGLAKQLAEVQEAWATLNVKVQERGRSWRRLPRATPSSDAVGNCSHALPPTPVCPPGPDSSFPSLPRRAWAQEKQGLVSSEELAGDVAGTERLLELLEELGQVKGHCHQAQNVQQEGQQLVDNGHFMSLESAPSPQMTECLQELDGRPRALREAWALRRERCEGSWQLQKLQQGLDQAEARLACREDLLLEPNGVGLQLPIYDSDAVLLSQQALSRTRWLLRSSEQPFLLLCASSHMPRADGGLGPEVNLQVAPNLRATSEDTLKGTRRPSYQAPGTNFWNRRLGDRPHQGYSLLKSRR
eukprot:bmy_09148T0